MLAIRSPRLRQLQNRSASRYLSIISDDHLNAIEQDSVISAIRSGTGASSSALEPVTTYGLRRYGLFQHSTGTTATGRAGVGISAPAFVCGQGQWIETEAEIYIPDLSDGTHTFTVLHGLTDDPSTITPANGILIRYSSALSSGQWEVWSQAAGGGAVSAASGWTVREDTWYRLRIWVQSDGRAIRAWVNDVEIAVPTTSTEYPKVTTQGVGFYCGINKTLSNTARTLIADWLWVAMGDSQEIPSQ